MVDETTVKLDIGGHAFLASGLREVEPGWRVVEAPGEAAGSEDRGVQLPALKKGQSVTVRGIEAAQKETTPPQRLSDASLLSAMKNAGRKVEDAGMAEVLKESGGLGTPATRAGMIEALLKRGYLIRKGKTLLSTDKGRALIGAVVEPLKSPELTATWERQLQEIEAGKGSAEGFVDATAAFVRELLPEVQGSAARVPAGASKRARNLGSCPLCGQDVIESPKAFGCSAWKDKGCGFKVWEGDRRKEARRKPRENASRQGPYAPAQGIQVESRQVLRGGAQAERGKRGGSRLREEVARSSRTSLIKVRRAQGGCERQRVLTGEGEWHGHMTGYP